MGTRGVLKNIAVAPLILKDSDEFERLIPSQIDLRNGRLSSAGNWVKRPGYNSGTFDISDTKQMVALIPVDNGYAVAEDGVVYDLSTLSSLSQKVTPKSGDPYGITHASHNALLILCSGGRPIKIEGGDSATLEGNPPNAKFVVRVDTKTVMSGYRDQEGEFTEFTWSGSGNPEQWDRGLTTDSGFASVRKDGGIIRNMVAIRGDLLFFKDRNIEVWSHVGGINPFQRNERRLIDVGLGADYSVVEANNTVYWFGDDENFYVLDGGFPMIVSSRYREEINSLNNQGLIYGFNFRAERIIRWFAPQDGRCFVYDYTNNVFSEDNEFKNSQWARLPISSYMEFNNKQYIGDYNPTGLVYEWSTDYKDDNGKPIRVFRRFAVKPFDGNRAKFNQVMFRVKRGTEAPSTTDPQLAYRYRLDRGNWVDYKYFDLGSHGDRDPWLKDQALGIGREIEFEVVENDATEYILTDVDIKVRELERRA